MGLLDFFKKLFGFKKPKKKKSFKKTSNSNPLKKSQRKFKKKTSKRSKKKIKRTPHKRQKPKTRQKAQIKSIPRKKSSKSKKFQKTFSKTLKRMKTPQEKEIGIITHYFGKISVGVIKLRAPLKVGEKIHIKGATTDFFQTVDSMQINHQNVNYAQRGQEVGIKVAQKVRENDKVYKVVY